MSTLQEPAPSSAQQGLHGGQLSNPPEPGLAFRLDAEAGLLVFTGGKPSTVSAATAW